MNKSMFLNTDFEAHPHYGKYIGLLIRMDEDCKYIEECAVNKYLVHLWNKWMSLSLEDDKTGKYYYYDTIIVPEGYGLLN